MVSDIPAGDGNIEKLFYGGLLLASPDIIVVSCSDVDAVVSDVIYAGDHSAVARVSAVVAFFAAVDFPSANGVPIFLASLLLLSALPLSLLFWGSMLLLASLLLLAYLQL